MFELPDHVVDELCKGRPLHDPEHGEIRLKLEIAGFDPDNELLVKLAVAAVRQRRRDARLLKSATGRLTLAMLNQREVADAIGMPKSTYQAMASGRIVERLTRENRVRLVEVIRYSISELEAALDLLRAKR